MINQAMKWFLCGTIVVVFFCCLPVGSGQAQVNLEYRRNVLPPAVAESLKPKKVLDVLQYQAARDAVLPVFIMVNPALLPPDRKADEEWVDQLEKRIKSWAKEEDRLDEISVKALARCEEQAPTIYRALQHVGEKFFGLFFRADNVTPVGDLRELVGKSLYKDYNTLIVACFDAQCWAKPGTGKSRLEVNLSLRLCRVYINRGADVYRIDRVETLFSDQAYGDAPIPTAPESGVTDEYTIQVKEKLQEALNSALKNKIALSLWCNPKLLAIPADEDDEGGRRRNYLSWIYQERKQIVEPSLSRDH